MTGSSPEDDKPATGLLHRLWSRLAGTPEDARDPRHGQSEEAFGWRDETRVPGAAGGEGETAPHGPPDLGPPDQDRTQGAGGLQPGLPDDVPEGPTRDPHLPPPVTPQPQPRPTVPFLPPNDPPLPPHVTQDPVLQPVDQGTPTPGPQPIPQGTPLPEPQPVDQGTPTPGPQPTPQGTPLPEPQPVEQGTPTPGPQPTPQGTPLPEPQPVDQGTPRPGPQPTPQGTPLPEPQWVDQGTPTPGPQPTPQGTPLPEPQPVDQGTPTPGPQPTPQGTPLPEPQPVGQGSPTPGPQPTPQGTPLPEPQLVDQGTPTPGPQPTPQGTPLPEPQPVDRGTPTPGPQPVPQGTPLPEPQPVDQGTPTPGPQPVPQGTPLPEPPPVDQGTPTPGQQPTPQGTPLPEPQPVGQGSPTPGPQPTPQGTPLPEPQPVGQGTPTPQIDHPAVIGGQDAGQVTEDKDVVQGMLTTGGQLSLQDPDSGQAAFVPISGQAGSYGSFTLQRDGSWTYQAENALAQIQQLGSGDILFDTVTVTSLDGTPHDITVTILGSDDAPVVTGGTGTVSELPPNVDALIGGLTDAGNPELGQHLEQVPPQVQSAVAQEVLWQIQQNPKDFGIPPGQAMHLADLDPKFVARWSDTINDIVLQKLMDMGYHPSMGQGLITLQSLPFSDWDRSTPQPAAAETIEITGQLTISDPDLGDNGFRADQIVGHYGTLEIAANGQWRYVALENQDAIQALGPDHHLTDLIEVETIDGHRSVVTITIEGAIDTPTLSVQTLAAGQTAAETVTAGIAELTIDAIEDQPISLNLSGHIRDTDSNETLALTLSGLPPGAQVANATRNADGTWSVSVQARGQVEVTPPPDFNGRMDILIEATAEAGGEVARSDLLLHVDVGPENDAALITGTDSGSVTEDLDVTQGALITFGVLDITDPDAGEATFVPHTDIRGSYGSFALAADGRWTYSALNSQAAIQALGVGDRLTDSVTISSVDGTTHDLTVTIQGSNDGPLLTADPLEAYEDGPVVTGHLTGSDIDVGKTLAYRLEGAAPAGFALLPDGAWRFDPSDSAYQSLGEGDHLLLKIPVSVTDDQGAQASATLEITVVGQNDQPVVSRAVTLPEGYEDSLRIITATQLLAMMQDPDAGDGLHVLGTPTADHGTVTPNVDGSWTFQPDADYAGPVTFTFEGADTHGAVVSATAVMDLKPVGDPAVIAGADKGAVTEDMVPTAAGQLTVLDPDAGEATFNPVSGDTGSGGYGRFFMEETGQWRYELDNHLSEVQALVPGRTLEDRLTVTSTDGTTHDLAVTISGTGDVPVITGIDRGSVTEDLDVIQGSLITYGNLDITDPDSGEAAFVPQTDIAGTYGSFALAADGRWTYSALNGQDAIQALGLGESLTDSVTITSVDGTTHALTVTIVGSNMGPVATPGDLGATAEDVPRTFTAAELLQATNASDPDGDPLSIAGVSVDAAHGVVTDNGNGTFTFTPAPDFAQDAVPLNVTISDGSEQVAVPALIDVTQVTDGTAPRLVLSAQQEVINTGPSSELGRIEIDQVQGSAVREFTIEFTVVADPVPDTKNYQGPVVFNMGSPSDPIPNNQNNFLTLWNPGNLRVGGANDHITGINLGDGDSHRITLTWDSQSGDLNLYDNGVLHATMGGYHRGETMPDDLYLVVGGKVQHVNSDNPVFYPHEHYEGDIFNLAMADHKLDDGQVAAGPLASQVDVGEGLLVDVRSVGGQIIDAAGVHGLSEFGGLSTRAIAVDTGLAVPPPGAMLQLEIDPGAPTDPDDRVTGVVVSGFLAGSVVSDGMTSVTVNGPTQQIDLAGWATDAMTAQLPPGDNSDFQVSLQVESTGPDGSVVVTTLDEPVAMDPGPTTPAPAPGAEAIFDDAPDTATASEEIPDLAEQETPSVDADDAEPHAASYGGDVTVPEAEGQVDISSLSGEPDAPEAPVVSPQPADPYLSAIVGTAPPEAAPTDPLPDATADPYAEALGIPAGDGFPPDGVDGARLVALDEGSGSAFDETPTPDPGTSSAEDVIDTDPSDPPQDDHQG